MFTEEALKTLLTKANGLRVVDIEDDIASQLLLINDDWSLKTLEDFQDKPNRVRRAPVLQSSESFCDYVNKFAKDESTVYLNVPDGKFIAILDHHTPTRPTWADHRASFTPKMSSEWLAWSSVHREKLSQLNLAYFIEENLDAIVHPEPNVMLKAALDFQSNEKLAFASAINLDDGGTRFNFTKDNANKSIEFPHRITVKLAVFENEEPVELAARVRYKTSSDGALSFVISFVQDPSRIQRDELRAVGASIRDMTNNLAQYEGTFK